MSLDLTNLDQLRLLAERTRENLDLLEEAITLLGGVSEGINTKVTSLQGTVENLDIPTKTSELTNDAKFQTDTDVANAIANADKLTRKKIDSLADIDLTADDADQYIYMLPVTDADGSTYYQQYMVIDGAAEAMGTTKVDLEGYLQESDVATDEEVDEVSFELGFLQFMPPEMHRMIFRGKNLGGVLTETQKRAIADGTFEDLWLGDYWVINGITWRIADIDYWLNTGNAYVFSKHHLVIMPDVNLGAFKKMNLTNTTEGGYVGSLMYTSNMDDAKTICREAFGDNVLTHQDMFCTQVTDGRPTGYIWKDASIELPTEVMLYGCSHFGVMNDGVHIPMKYAIDKSQLSLFNVAPKFITTRQIYWLQDILSGEAFAAVDHFGNTSRHWAAVDYSGIRPVFAIGVPD